MLTLRNPQLHCKLLSVPLEIRQEIYIYLFPYGFHVCTHQGRMHLSECAEPLTNGGLIGQERRDFPSFVFTDPVWMRRLQSPWGQHWKGEEVALAMEESRIDLRNTDTGLMRTCKIT